MEKNSYLELLSHVTQEMQMSLYIDPKFRQGRRVVINL